MGIVSAKGEDDTINIKSFLIGDKYAEALGHGLKHSMAHKVNLSQNRLKPTGALKIIEGMNSNIREIDLSDNRIGESNACIEQLVNGVISDRKFLIETLILDQNRINDKQALILFESLLVTSNRSIRVLSLG